ncbi:BA75_02903T0 [Komagataella pastoris]|uniref:BA75_02903T0 n=1 Tax=Komagataella pastoris TaxID=4922 RepID=A0A1B2JDL6_PICPA|nr:BA75_02903T0 [Komagataella pastoris]
MTQRTAAEYRVLYNFLLDKYHKTEKEFKENVETEAELRHFLRYNTLRNAAILDIIREVYPQDEDTEDIEDTEKQIIESILEKKPELKMLEPLLDEGADHEDPTLDSLMEIQFKLSPINTFNPDATLEQDQYLARIKNKMVVKLMKDIKMLPRNYKEQDEVKETDITGYTVDTSGLKVPALDIAEQTPLTNTHYLKMTNPQIFQEDPVSKKRKLESEEDIEIKKVKE